LAALGIIIIFRTSRTTNFAQGSIGMFNAFVATFAFIHFGLPTWAAAIVGMIAAFVSGVLVDVVIIRKAKKTSPVAKQIITFGVIMLFLGVAPMIFGSTPLNFPKFIESGAIDIFGASISYNALLNKIVGLVIMGVLFYF
ncbi:branched-chain amino acid ABC transporter permease, partial [Clostridium perfringens]